MDILLEISSQSVTPPNIVMELAGRGGMVLMKDKVVNRLHVARWRPKKHSEGDRSLTLYRGFLKSISKMDAKVAERVPGHSLVKLHRGWRAGAGWVGDTISTLDIWAVERLIENGLRSYGKEAMTRFSLGCKRKRGGIAAHVCSRAA